ncbi:hypothetical protein [Hyphomicrobium sp. DY-1]|uniref:hypothetical protein n=1 Tax=Hyphomicrobium sp. DY-1 TaxID=3075650 RepID=UPI0039C49A0E
MQLASKPHQLARSTITKIADIAATDIAIGTILGLGMIAIFAALPLFVGDFFLILPGLWP